MFKQRNLGERSQNPNAELGGGVSNDYRAT